MLTRQATKVLVGLALVLALVGRIALGISPSTAQTAQAVSGPTTQHVLADVDPVPPGH